MHYYITHDAAKNQEAENQTQTRGLRRNVDEFRELNSPADLPDYNGTELLGRYLPLQNTPDEQIQNAQSRQRLTEPPLFWQSYSNRGMGHLHSFMHPIHKHIFHARETIRQEQNQQDDTQQFYKESLHTRVRGWRENADWREQQKSNEDLEVEEEIEKQDEQKNRVPAKEDNFEESFQDMTVRDLFDQCQGHFHVINTCAVLQEVIRDEMLKQAKLEEALYQKLTSKAQRLQQQTVFIKDVTDLNWAKAALTGLASRVTETAHVHKQHADSTQRECEEIQRYLDNLHAEQKHGRKHTILAEAQMENTTGADEMQSFLQTTIAFDRLSKPWLKMLSLQEYQQEQYEATVIRIRQLESEMEAYSDSEANENMVWAVKMRKKDIETKKEILEARKEHLQAELQNAQKQLEEFEHSNRDNILNILNVLRRLRARCDTDLRQHFQLLQTTFTESPLSNSRASHETAHVDHNVNEESFDKARALNCYSSTDGAAVAQARGHTERGDDVTSRTRMKRSNTLYLLNSSPGEFISHMSGLSLKAQTKATQEKANSSEHERPAGDVAYGYHASMFDFIRSNRRDTGETLQAERLDNASDYNVSRAFREPTDESLSKSDDEEDIPALGPTITAAGCDNATQASHEASSPGQDIETIAGNSKDGGDTNSDQSRSYQNNCGGKEDSSGAAEYDAENECSDGNAAEETARNVRHLNAVKRAKDVLAGNYGRTAYFISKYATTKRSNRSFLHNTRHLGHPVWLHINKNCSHGNKVPGLKVNGSEKQEI